MGDPGQMLCGVDGTYVNRRLQIPRSTDIYDHSQGWLALAMLAMSAVAAECSFGANSAAM